MRYKWLKLFTIIYTDFSLYGKKYRHLKPDVSISLKKSQKKLFKTVGILLKKSLSVFLPIQKTKIIYISCFFFFFSYELKYSKCRGLIWTEDVKKKGKLTFLPTTFIKNSHILSSNQPTTFWTLWVPNFCKKQVIQFYLGII